MKVVAGYIAVFVIAFLTIPMLALNFDLADTKNKNVYVPISIQKISEPTAPFSQDFSDADQGFDTAAEQPNSADTEFFMIFDETTKKIEKVSVRDFVRGALAAEMPASFHEEALKAQAVAAHTFALRSQLLQKNNPADDLQGADFSADPTNFKIYITEMDARRFYGENADMYWRKISAAADSVLPFILEYKGEPIVAAYHAISAGQTEDAANIWGRGAPYLTAAPSEGDILAPEFESTVRITAEDARVRLTEKYPDITLPADPAQWFTITERSNSGYVTEITAGDITLHGKDVRLLFSLRSHNFNCDFNSGVFLFTVYGYGHGVGLSQYGADYLARQGFAFNEILEHYYSGAILTPKN